MRRQIYDDQNKSRAGFAAQEIVTYGFKDFFPQVKYKEVGTITS